MLRLQVTIPEFDHATNYLTGNIFHLDWALGKQLNPAWKIGVVG
jgi:hypothetical protein